MSHLSKINPDIFLNILVQRSMRPKSPVLTLHTLQLHFAGQHFSAGWTKKYKGKYFPPPQKKKKLHYELRGAWGGGGGRTVAQSVERATFDEDVIRSIPAVAVRSQLFRSVSV